MGSRPSGKEIAGKPRRRKEWFDDDALWRELYPYLFPKGRFAEAAGQVDQVLALAAPPGKTALDLCCGPGRFAIPLARKGFRVTGVDRTKLFLDRARARSRGLSRRLEWVRADMRDFVRPGAYDLVLNMFTSFGYFDDKSEDRAVLGNMAASLRPGGACVLEMVGKEILARSFQPAGWTDLPGGAVLVEHREVFDDWTRVRNEWILIKRGRARHFAFHHTVYSGQELRDRMTEAGLTDVRLYGDLEGSVYGPGARRLIAVGRKPV